MKTFTLIACFLLSMATAVAGENHNQQQQIDSKSKAGADNGVVNTYPPLGMYITSTADLGACQYSQRTGVMDPNCVNVTLERERLKRAYETSCTKKEKYVEFSIMGMISGGHTEQVEVDSELCDAVNTAILDSIVATLGITFDPKEFEAFVSGYRASEKQNKFQSVSNKELYRRWVMHKVIQAK